MRSFFHKTSKSKNIIEGRNKFSKIFLKVVKRFRRKLVRGFSAVQKNERSKLLKIQPVYSNSISILFETPLTLIFVICFLDFDKRCLATSSVISRLIVRFKSLAPYSA